MPVAERLTGFALRTAPASYHCWWELPAPWPAETFVAAAARRGIAVTPAAAFAVGAAHVPVLVAALDTLALLGRRSPADDGVEWRRPLR